MRLETAGHKDLVVFFADFPGCVIRISSGDFEDAHRKPSAGVIHLIDGGAPAGISILPVDEGCRTTRTSIRIITIQGNRSTAPRGMETFELPFKRIRRRKKANLGVIRSVWRDTSSREGRLGEEGIRFTRF